jgi:hypothetical protein
MKQHLIPALAVALAAGDATFSRVNGNRLPLSTGKGHDDHQ